MDDLPADIDAESARTTTRTSARNARIEVITRREPRRSWTLEQKREIVAESFGPELTATEVARKHGLSSGQLYTWRRQLLSEADTRAAPHFARVELAQLAPPAEASAPVSQPLQSHGAGTIEIELSSGIKLRVDTGVDGRALRRVLAALGGR